MTKPLKGRCLCGGVTYKVTAPAEKSSACHCGQCRRQSGHIWASAQCADDAITISGESLSWYRSSDTATRGFCSECGSFLFWKHDEEDLISFSLGSLDSPTGLQLSGHIFVADKGDYYAIDDGLPQQD